MLLDPNDDLSTVLTLGQAAEAAQVSRRTLNRWIHNGHLEPLPGRMLTERMVLDCERDRYLASHQGRPGARPRHLDPAGAST